MAKRRQSLAGRVAAVEKAVARFFMGKKKKAKNVAKKRSKALAANKAKTKTKATRERLPKRAKKSVASRAAKRSRPRPKATTTVPTPDQLAPSGEPNLVARTDTL